MRMAADLSFNLAVIGAAMMRRGGRASLLQIYRDVREVNPDWCSRYGADETLAATVRTTIEDHCPQSENYSTRLPALFERLRPGEYRVIPSDERAGAEVRGRRIGR